MRSTGLRQQPRRSNHQTSSTKGGNEKLGEGNTVGKRARQAGRRRGRGGIANKAVEDYTRQRVWSTRKEVGKGDRSGQSHQGAGGCTLCDAGTTQACINFMQSAGRQRRTSHTHEHTVSRARGVSRALVPSISFPHLSAVHDVRRYPRPSVTRE